jgi:nitrous oxidase accessory protein NosD
MKLPLPRTRRVRLAGAALALVGGLAAAAPWVDRLRPLSPDIFLTERLRVTSGADSGPGTLREAIFAGDRAGRAARVELAVGRVVLESPLPPLLNPNGMTIDASRSHTQIVGRQAGNGPVLDVSAPHSMILGLRITEAAGQAVLVRANGLTIRNVIVEDSEVGVYLVEGAGELSVSDSSFRRNAVAIHLPGDSRQVTLQNNSFEGHRETAIWAASRVPPPVGGPPQLEILRNHSKSDAQPLVLVNVSARVEDNLFEDARTSAAYVNGSTAVIRRNRMRAGRGFGIEVVGLESGLIANNELDHNCAGGVLAHGSRNTEIVSNRIYANGSGIVMVSGEAGNPNRVADNLVAQHQLDGLHLIGASPLVERNQLLQNQQAGLRISTLNAGGRVVSVSKPRLSLNVVSGNGVNERTDEYVPGPAVAVAALGDCPWRLGGNPVRFASQEIK